MKNGSSLLLLLITFQLSGQVTSPDKDILLSVAGQKVTAGEFTRMYLKSNELQGGVTPEEYLEHYILFKQKVADAISEGIDTTRAFINELNGYRKQLAQSYLTDNKTKEELLRKAYQRYLVDISARHILVSCPEGAPPEDTLAAWKKAADIRERIIRGEPFDLVARSASDDPSARINGGNLGYFTVFQMIMPFEDAAYTLRKGQISQPVRSPYGYHIIKVEDTRKSMGKVLVAHIMKVTPPGSDDSTLMRAESGIRSIYSELQNGASFSGMAMKYSDHKESARSGGLLNWFGTGEITSEFAEAAFAIKDTGNISMPVKTTYGWHIIKLIDRKGPGTFEEMRSWLESRINQSYLNSLSRKTFVEKLKKEHKLTVNEESFDWFVNNTDTLIIRGESKYSRELIPKGNICTFTANRITNTEFASYLEKGAYKIITTDPQYFIKESLNNLVSDKLIEYENSILENKYPEFRYLMGEFHDGILLFEISGRKVWNRVAEDSAALYEYYLNNRERYLSDRSLDVSEYSLSDIKYEKKLVAAYRKYSGRNNGDELLIRKFNNDQDTILKITHHLWRAGDPSITQETEWKPGAYPFNNGDKAGLIVVHKVVEPEPLPFESVKAELLNGFQEELENRWIQQLKKSYPVNVDNAVFSGIKESLKNE